MIGWVLSKPLGVILGFIYPSYCSFKALETLDDPQDDQQWLTYWIVFSMFSVVEGIADYILPWFPFYYEIKIAIVLWLQMPTTRGALVVYNNFVHPWLKEHEKTIDERLDEAKERAKEASAELAAKGLEKAKEFGGQALETTVEYVKNNETVRNAVGSAILGTSDKPADANNNNNNAEKADDKSEDKKGK